MKCKKTRNHMFFPYILFFIRENSNILEIFFYLFAGRSAPLAHVFLKGSGEEEGVRACGIAHGGGEGGRHKKVVFLHPSSSSLPPKHELEISRLKGFSPTTTTHNNSPSTKEEEAATGNCPEKREGKGLIF